MVYLLILSRRWLVHKSTCSCLSGCKYSDTGGPVATSGQEKKHIILCVLSCLLTLTIFIYIQLHYHHTRNVAKSLHSFCSVIRYQVAGAMLLFLHLHLSAVACTAFYSYIILLFSIYSWVFFSMLYLLYFGQHRSVGYGHAAFIVSPCSWCFAVRATVVTDTVFIYLFLIFIFL